MDKSLRILLLEDNSSDAELAQHELENAKISFTAMRVETREEFLKALAEFSPDVILSEYSLPDFNGKEALMIAKERAPDTPFILVTSSVSEDTAVECMKAGATDYVLKDRLKRLAPAVEAALEFRHMVTHRQQAEGALRESEMKFRALAETSPYAIVVYRDGKILYANKTVETMSGYTLEEISSMSFLQLIHPDFRDLVMQRASARLRGESVPSRYELKILTRSGEERWLDITAGLFEYEGKPAGIATAFDITERKQVEENLAYQAQLLANVSDSIIASDEQFRLTAWNAAAEKLYGWKADEVIGSSGIEVMRTEFPGVKAEEMRRQIAETGSWRGEVTQLRKDGVRIPVEVASIVLRDQTGHITGYVSVNRDITDRKRVEESLTARARQQAAVAELGQRALEGGDLQPLMDHAVVLVAKTLDLEYSKVLELLPEGKSLLLRAGVGWRPGIVGYATVGAGVDSQAGFTLHSVQPVIVEDLLAETRFKGPPLLTEHGVVSGVSVIISGRKKAFGVLGAHTTHKRMFTIDDIHFVQSIANVIAIALQRKQAEEALRDSEQRQHSILDSVNEIVYMVEARKENMLNGKLVFVSRRTKKIIGYDPEEFTEDPGLWFKLLHPEDIPTVIGKTNEMYSNKQPQTREYRIRHKLTGEYVWMEDRVEPQLSAEGEVVGQFGVARDITEHKQVQERLVKLSSAVEQSADCIFITDNNGVIQYVNKAFEDTTGYGNQEAIGKTPRILKSGKHDDAFYAKFWEEILSGKAVHVEFLNRRKNGEIYHDERTVTCLKDEKGSITNFVATGRDVTARRRAEEALRKTGDRLRFLTRRMLAVQESERRAIAREIHDELGGAFTTIKVNLQAMQSNRRQAEQAPRIIDSIGIVDRAIDQIRALSISLRPSALDDLGLPAALRWYIDRQAQRVGFVPSVSIAPSLPRFSQDVETACFRVAQEVLTNVARHAKASKVILGLYVDTEQLHLVITDDGVGFDVEKVKAQHELGLGILGMQERVSFAGGFFELESSTGRGTKVSAHFPLPAHNSSQASPQSAGGG